MPSTMLNALPLTDLAFALQLRYLDSPRERASECILREIGVSAASVAKSADAQPAGDVLTALDDARLAEHSAADGAAVAYEALAGRVFLDVRDAGDAWIRMALTPGLRVTLSASTSRRFVLDRLVDAATLQLRETRVGTERKALQLVPRFSRAADALEVTAYHTYRELICALCRQFYDAGWVTGTGGSISIRYGNRIYMTPSGVQKERISPDDLYMLDLDGAILDAPEQKPGTRKVPKLSDCSPLFLHAYRLRDAGAVLHSHGMSCNLVTALCDGQTEFRITHQEMIKGLAGFGYHDELVLPIIENTAVESQLADSLAEAMQRYPRAPAVLVRRHGIYVWGDSWEAAKRHAECLHYLFDAAIEMHKLRLDYTTAPPLPLAAASDDGPQRKRPRSASATSAESLAESHQYVLLDIEGTTTPITFVHDVLFPFAHRHAQSFLAATWTTDATQRDIAALCAQAATDATDAALEGVPALALSGDRDRDIAAVVAYVHWNMARDRKMTALKQLQGHIWDLGYANGELRALVYADVPPFLERMAASGVRVGIYSSGSREAQRALFKFSDRGDLRRWLSVYFDTRVGGKRDAASYREILQSLGVDSGCDVLFVTDVLEEATAATAAGLDVALSVRPGNKPLPADHGFKTIRSFAELAAYMQQQQPMASPERAAASVQSAATRLSLLRRVDSRKWHYTETLALFLDFLAQVLAVSFAPRATFALAAGSAASRAVSAALLPGYLVSTAVRLVGLRSSLWRSHSSVADLVCWGLTIALLVARYLVSRDAASAEYALALAYLVVVALRLILKPRARNFSKKLHKLRANGQQLRVSIESLRASLTRIPGITALAVAMMETDLLIICGRDSGDMSREELTSFLERALLYRPAALSATEFLSHVRDIDAKSTQRAYGTVDVLRSSLSHWSNQKCDIVICSLMICVNAAVSPMMAYLLAKLSDAFLTLKGPGNGDDALLREGLVGMLGLCIPFVLGSYAVGYLQSRIISKAVKQMQITVLNTILHQDQGLGRVAEEGRYDELVRKNGLFYEMVDSLGTSKAELATRIANRRERVTSWDAAVCAAGASQFPRSSLPTAVAARLTLLRRVDSRKWHYTETLALFLDFLAQVLAVSFAPRATFALAAGSAASRAVSAALLPGYLVSTAVRLVGLRSSLWRSHSSVADLVCWGLTIALLVARYLVSRDAASAEYALALAYLVVVALRLILKPRARNFSKKLHKLRANGQQLRVSIESLRASLTRIPGITALAVAMMETDLLIICGRDSGDMSREELTSFLERALLYRPAALSATEFLAHVRDIDAKMSPMMAYFLARLTEAFKLAKTLDSPDDYLLRVGFVGMLSLCIPFVLGNYAIGYFQSKIMAKTTEFLQQRLLTLILQQHTAFFVGRSEGDLNTLFSGDIARVNSLWQALFWNLFNPVVSIVMGFGYAIYVDLSIGVMGFAFAAIFVSSGPQGFAAHCSKTFGSKNAYVSSEFMNAVSCQKLVRALDRARHPDNDTDSDDASSLPDLPKMEKDLRVEKLVFNKMNMTIISVTHRLSTAVSADLILVLNKGRVAEEGRYDELVRKNGLFYEMVHSNESINIGVDLQSGRSYSFASETSLAEEIVGDFTHQLSLLMKAIVCVATVDGSVFTVEIDERQRVWHLQEKIKEKKPSLVTCDADRLTLFLAKDAAGEWLKTHEAAMLQSGQVSERIQKVTTTRECRMRPMQRIANAAFELPDDDDAGEDDIHVLVQLPPEDEQLRTGRKLGKRKRYICSKVGLLEGKQLMQDLNIHIKPVRVTSLANEGMPRVAPLTWKTSGSDVVQEINLTIEELRHLWGGYISHNVGDVLHRQGLYVHRVQEGDALLGVQVPGRDVELSGCTDLLILSDLAHSEPDHLQHLPEVKMLIDVKEDVKDEDDYQTVSRLLALDIRADEPVIALLTDLRYTWRFFWVSEMRHNKVILNKANVFEPRDAFEMMRLVLAQSPTEDDAGISLPHLEQPMKRRKLAELLPSSRD
ncbi:hypothetical protein P43SY_008597 [Pythium insidiosum]|uniref:Probable methylthioribulose-1-phosphate dehydratase n=1 Tax=Pythium insidiosum TaxID=114742 RepID=A0AAD5LWN7_PYTIN|nr:hypothetical protein P43SY_008597 [Pythium insidiosum]